MTEDDRRFRAARVFGTETEDEPADAAAAPAAEPSHRRRRDPDAPSDKQRTLLAEPRAPGVGRDARTGLAVLLASLVVLILMFTLPWFDLNGDALDRGESRRPTVVPPSTDYFDRTMAMPVWGFVLTGAAGLLWIASDVATRTRGAKNLLATVVAGLGLLGSLLAALAATRLWGYWLTQAMDPGDLRLSPHAALYLLAVAAPAGLFVFLRLGRAATGVWASVSDDETAEATQNAAAWGLAVAAGALLLLPLFPLATDFGAFDGADHLGEGELFEEADFALGDRSVRRLADDVERTHALLWWTLATSAAAMAAAWFARLPGHEQLHRTLVQVFLLVGVYWIVLLVTAILFYFSHVPGLTIGIFGGDSYTPAFNHVMPAALAGLGWALWGFARRVTLPFVRHAAVEARQARAPEA